MSTVRATRLPPRVGAVVACCALSVGAQGPSEESAALLEQGRRAYAVGQYAVALSTFTEATRSTDTAIATPAKHGVVRTALRTAEFALARRVVEGLLADGARDGALLALHGDVSWAHGLFDDAEEAYEAATRASTSLMDAHRGLAQALASRGLFERALAEAGTALSLDPEDAELRAVTGSIYERLGRYTDAAAAYEAYAARLPSSERVAASTARGRAHFLLAFRGRRPLEVEPWGAGLSRPVPFKLVNHKVVLQGRLNGAAVDFVLDTGAERTAITPDVALRAGVRTQGSTFAAGVGRSAWRRVALARVDTLEVGPLRVRHVPVAVRAPARGGAPRWQGQTLSPLALGVSVVVDYPRKEVRFGRQLPVDASDLALPMRMHRLPLVRGTLNGGRQAAFIVDTGGEVISLNGEVAESLDVRAPRHIPLRVQGLEGVDESAFLLPGVDLDIASISYRRIGVAVLDLRSPSVLLGFQVGGIVGHMFLADRRVSFDLARSELRLSR
ncbi:MAG TPA: aspartyl protease family protein [Vicinamibacterales bacterium]